MDLSEDFCSHPSPSHPSEDTLELYALKRLTGHQAAPIEEHLFHCTKCQEALARTEEFALPMRAALRQPVLEPSPAPSLEFWSGMRAWLPRLRVSPQGLQRAGWAVGLAAICGLAMSLPRGSDAGADPAPVMLSSFRGSQTVTMAHGPARTPLELGIDAFYLRAGEDCRIEIVHADGSPAWDGQADRTAEGRLHARVGKGLSAGTYWVRLYRDHAELIQEFGLELE